jgi:hypothetical protein
MAATNSGFCLNSDIIMALPCPDVIEIKPWSGLYIGEDARYKDRSNKTHPKPKTHSLSFLRRCVRHYFAAIFPHLEKTQLFNQSGLAPKGA